MREGLRRVVLHVLGRLSKYCQAQRGAFLCLHSVVETPPAPDNFSPLQELAVSIAFLETLVVELRRLGFDLVSVEEGLARLRAGDARRFVAFTFDDGYADNFTRAYPILRRHQVPFALFLTTGYLDRALPMWWVVFHALLREREHLVLPDCTLPARTPCEKLAAFAAARELVIGTPPDRLPRLFDRIFETNAQANFRDLAFAAALTWDDVRSMAASGLVTIGCHTVNHPILADTDAQTCAAEVARSRDRIAAEIGERPRYFAYPYGGESDIGADAPGIVAAAGFDAAFTTRNAILRSGTEQTAYAIPRVIVGAEDILLTRAYVAGLPSVARDVPKRIWGRRVA